MTRLDLQPPHNTSLRQMSRHASRCAAAACNRHIKFDALLRFATAMGADCVATGHYARLRHDPEGAATSHACCPGTAPGIHCFERLLTPRHQ